MCFDFLSLSRIKHIKKLTQAWQIKLRKTLNVLRQIDIKEKILNSDNPMQT